MRDIIIEPFASDDLAKYIAFYDARRDGLGLEFLARVRSMLQKIAENPRLYPVFYRDTRKALLDRFPFLILCRFDDEKVQVIGVMHASRDPRHFRSRIRDLP
jgi:toxin ParE1/3/4